MSESGKSKWSKAAASIAPQTIKVETNPNATAQERIEQTISVFKKRSNYFSLLRKLDIKMPPLYKRKETAKLGVKAINIIYYIKKLLKSFNFRLISIYLIGNNLEILKLFFIYVLIFLFLIKSNFQKN